MSNDSALTLTLGFSIFVATAIYRGGLTRDPIIHKQLIMNLSALHQVLNHQRIMFEDWMLCPMTVP